MGELDAVSSRRASKSESAGACRSARLDGPRHHGGLARLSLQAVRSAAARGPDDDATLFEYLYAFNSTPPSRAWSTRFSDTDAVRAELGLRGPSGVRALLEDRWVRMPREVDRGWLAWGVPHAGGEVEGADPRLKLYISPSIEALEFVFSEVVRVVTVRRSRCVKVGANVAALLRPDKLVAYFSSLEDLVGAGYELAQRLEGVSAQGVPFTAEISCDGLLSWALDPPECGSSVARPSVSWREWICWRLAAALVASRSEADGTDARAGLALDRLREDGVDTDRWSPPTAFWRTAPW